MPDEPKNPADGIAGQTPANAGATEPLPELTADQKKGMSTEQINYYENARKMVAASTQRYQEAATIRKESDEQLQQLKDEKAYYEQKYGEAVDKMNELIDQFAKKPAAQADAGNAGDSDILSDPQKFAKGQVEKITALEKTIAELNEKITLIPAKIEFEKKIDTLIATHKYVDRDKLNDYFDKKGEKYPVNDQTLALAAKEISLAETRRLDDLIKTRRAELEAAQKSATSQVAGNGTPPAGAPDIGGYHDKSPVEQQEIIRKIWRQANNL